jgi:hypothetical protein
MNTIFKKPIGKNLKMYIINGCAKTPETSGKIGESYNIECHNCSYEKSLWEKNQETNIILY